MNTNTPTALADRTRKWNKQMIRIIASLILLFASLSANAQLTTTILDTPGENFWTVPCGVTEITVAVYGAGGGGGGANSTSIGGGGGGAGGYAEALFTVTPGDIFQYSVGFGGIGGGPAGNGATGQRTEWSNGVLFANGGTGGFCENLFGFGGIGGNASNWTTNVQGANGANGTAQTGGNGGAAGGPNGGAIGVGGAPGVIGGIGGSYGGGGGGGGAKSGATNTLGGNGASGAVIITYQLDYILPNAGSDVSTCNVIVLDGNQPSPDWTGNWTVISGNAIIADPTDPNSVISLPNPGTCVTARWTFTNTVTNCPDEFDDVVICYPALCNDDPCGAIPLTVNSGSCQPTIYSNINATASTGMVEPGCGSYLDNDAWYTAVVPANGTLTINAYDAAGGPAMRMGIAIYEGADCNSVFHQGCDAANSSLDQAELTYLGTPGETVYIRVWEANEQESNYNLCAFTHGNAYGDIIPGETAVTCGTPMTFMDPGGNGNYANNTGGSYILCPDTPGQYVTVDFSSGANFFNVENGYDLLTILDGDYDASPVIGQWTGTMNPGIITSSAEDGCLTVIFQSDVAITAPGWRANVECSSIAGVNDTICSSTNCSGGCGTWICSDGLYPTTNDGNAIEDLAVNTAGCFTSSGEIASKWFYFTALTSGTIEFSFAGPNGQDYNLAIWGPSTNGVPPCPMNTGDAPVLCSSADVSSSGGNPVGVSSSQGGSQSYEGFEGDGWVRGLDVVAGETYAMILNIFQNGNPQPVIDLTIGGSGTLDCAPVFLPIELQSFSGMNKGERNLLSWITNSESNNDYFTIERSINGFDWELVDYVDGAGTSTTARYYSLVDPAPYFPVSYYRLTQTDFDGTRVHHDVIAVNGEKKASSAFVSAIFPNPADRHSTFTYNGYDTQNPLVVVVTNEFGKVVYEMETNDVTHGMPISLRTDQLSSGMYQVSFYQGSIRSVQKLSIIH